MLSFSDLAPLIVAGIAAVFILFLTWLSWHHAHTSPRRRREDAPEAGE